MAKRKKKTVNVAFGSVSIGDTTARVGLTVAREELDIGEADELLCGRRLTGFVETVPPKVDPDQGELFEGETEKHSVSGSFDVHRFGVSPKQFTAGLTFALAEIDRNELGYCAKRPGRLVVDKVGAIPDGEDPEPG